MAVGKREVWRCRVCRQRHSGNESRSEASSSQGASPAGTEHLRSLEAKLECLTLLKANVDTLLDLPTQMNQLLTLKPVVESLKSAVTEVQKAVDFLSARYDSLLSTATTNSTAITELREETTLLRSVVTEQSQTIEHLKEELNDSDQYSRLSNLEIHGLPHAPSENLVSVVGELAGKLGLENFQPRDILAVHRLPSRRDGPPVILVKLASVSLREQWLATREPEEILDTLTRESLCSEDYSGVSTTPLPLEGEEDRACAVKEGRETAKAAPDCAGAVHQHEDAWERLRLADEVPTGMSFSDYANADANAVTTEVLDDGDILRLVGSVEGVAADDVDDDSEVTEALVPTPGQVMDAIDLLRQFAGAHEGTEDALDALQAYEKHFPEHLVGTKAKPRLKRGSFPTLQLQGAPTASTGRKRLLSRAGSHNAPAISACGAFSSEGVDEPEEMLDTPTIESLCSEDYSGVSTTPLRLEGEEDRACAVKEEVDSVSVASTCGDGYLEDAICLHFSAECPVEVETASLRVKEGKSSQTHIEKQPN
ncbi:uncharacterized protein ISCGN_019760 [Ixodes scapularis]